MSQSSLDLQGSKPCSIGHLALFLLISTGVYINFL